MKINRKVHNRQRFSELIRPRLFLMIGYLTLSLQIVLAMVCPSIADDAASVTNIDPPGCVGSYGLSGSEPEILDSGIGPGFRSGTKVLGLSVGAAYGMLMLGGEERHHLALISASYGRVIGNVIGKGKWYEGNVELRAELFSGAQINSHVRAITGLTPHLRYHFNTGTRIVPYIDAGVGVSLTEIRGEDLGGVFQFNEQGIIGLDYFIGDKMSFNLALQYLHVSSAGIYMPNDGVNTFGCFLGLNWLY